MGVTPSVEVNAYGVITDYTIECDRCGSHVFKVEDGKCDEYPGRTSSDHLKIHNTHIPAMDEGVLQPFPFWGIGKKTIWLCDSCGDELVKWWSFAK